MKTFLARIIARKTVNKIRKTWADPGGTQRNLLINLTQIASGTTFGREHALATIKNYDDFKQRVPVRDYEQLKEWFDLTAAGNENVLWPGKPIYLAKTSGTTSGTKYIPITKDSISNHINGAKHALLSYIHETGNADFLNGKMIFLQGSPALDSTGGIPTGRLSGIVAHHVPRYLQTNRMPSWEVNRIEDWEEKVDAIARETITEDMTLISGIPPWVQMYFDRLKELSEKNTIAEIFPKFSLFVYGGVNYQPYKAQLEKTIGKSIDSIETYPASEGFIAYQDTRQENGLLLQLNQGIFFEFIPADQYGQQDAQRLAVDQVSIGVNYAIVLTSNAGLWAYSLGDTVKFVSLDPPRIIVTGRIKHYTSAFGEHVIAEEVESALDTVVKELPARIAEFHVAPQVNPTTGLPYHEWLVAFEELPADPEKFAAALDFEMQKRNSYYEDLIKGKILRPLKLTPLPADTFIKMMRKRGKLGGQNKVPRLSNDRVIAEELLTA